MDTTSAIDFLVGRVKERLPSISIETRDVFIQDASSVVFMANYGEMTFVCASKYFSNHHSLMKEELYAEADLIINMIAGHFGRKLFIKEEE